MPQKSGAPPARRVNIQGIALRLRALPSAQGDRFSFASLSVAVKFCEHPFVPFEAGQLSVLSPNDNRRRRRTLEPRGGTAPPVPPDLTHRRARRHGAHADVRYSWPPRNIREP